MEREKQSRERSSPREGAYQCLVGLPAIDALSRSGKLSEVVGGGGVGGLIKRCRGRRANECGQSFLKVWP